MQGNGWQGNAGEERGDVAGDNVGIGGHGVAMRWVLMLFVILAAVMGGEARAVVVMGRVVMMERVGKDSAVERRVEDLRGASPGVAPEVDEAADWAVVGPSECWFPGGAAVARSDGLSGTGTTGCRRVSSTAWRYDLADNRVARTETEERRAANSTSWVRTAAADQRCLYRNAAGTGPNGRNQLSQSWETRTRWDAESGAPLELSEQTVNYRYDPRGNRTRRTTRLWNQARTTGIAAWPVPLVTDTDEALEWDGENRLTGMWRGPWKEELAQVPFESLVGEAVAGSTVWRWGYDHRSRRVQRDEPGSDGERLRTVTVFSGGTSAAEYTETAAAGSAAGSAWTVPPAATVQHVRGPDLGGGTKGLLYSLRNGLPTFNRYNGRGDVVAQSDIDGTTTWAASYQADGRRTAEAGTNVERHRACTKEEDPTGLLNEGFRYRDMETGTFISRDPLGLVDGPNVYAYVQQNPWSKFDADGLFWSAVITAGFAVYDTYQYATGQMNGAEYAGAMALNGAALLADVSTAGMGGGLLVRAGSAAVKVAKVVDKADTVYSTVNGAIRTSEAIANGDGTGAVVNGLLTAVGAKQMGGGGKAPDAPGLAPPSGKSAQDTMGEPRPLDLPGAGTVEAAKGGGFCFPAGTMVVMADGSARAIEEIKEGDEVMADDPADALPPSSKPVTHLHKNWTQRFIHIHIDTNSDGLTDAQLRATGEHPFWVVGKGWVDAQELQSGDALMSDGVASPVVVATESVATTADTFNLTVRDSHTFFVRAGLVSVLVHNTEPWEFNSSVDLDWTGRGGNGYQQMHGALDEAFSRTGVPRSSFEVSTWGLDQHGKSFPTEWRAPGGAEVNIDDPRLVRSANGP